MDKKWTRNRGIGMRPVLLALIYATALYVNCNCIRLKTHHNKRQSQYPEHFDKVKQNLKFQL